MLLNFKDYFKLIHFFTYFHEQNTLFFLIFAGYSVVLFLFIFFDGNVSISLKKNQMVCNKLNLITDTASTSTKCAILSFQNIFHDKLTIII